MFGKVFIVLLLAAGLFASEKTITLPTIYKPTSGDNLYQAALAYTDRLSNVTVSDAFFVPLPLGEYAVAALAGTPTQGLILMLDTANRYFWFTTEECTTCMNPFYITSLSTTFQDLHKSITDIRYNFGQIDGTATGTEAKEVIAVVGYSLSELNVAAVKSQSGNVFLGMWVYGGVGLNYNSFKDDLGYISQLYKKDIIKKRIVGLFLAKNDTEIKIGGYNAEKAKDIQYFNAHNHNGMFDVQSRLIKYGDIVSVLKYHSGILLMHSPFMLFPKDAFDPIADKISKKLGKSCYVDAGTSLFWCDVDDYSLSPFDDLVVGLDGGKNYTIYPYNYVEFGENEGKKFAVLRILVIKDINYIGIGTPFLKSVYTVIDREDDKIGFKQLPRSSFAKASYGIFFAVILTLALLFI